MSRNWGISYWNTFKWGGSAEFDTLLDRKDGLHPKRRITLKLAAGDVDLTSYFISASSVYQEKERAPDRISAGDATLVFSNASDLFTETNTAGFLYNKIYHNKDIVFEVGLELISGSVEYIKITTMKVKGITFSSDNSRVTIRVYDSIRRLLTETINRKPESMVPTAGASNVGNGKCSDIDIRPFITVAENWTLTCTLGGGDSTATFSVVGSIAGNIGTATSGTEFLNATTGGIKLTIRVGTINWAIDDAFTFSTVKMMEFDVVDPIKIIWSILTGKNFDTGASEGWLDRTPQLSGTLNSSNVDLNYDSFVLAAANTTFDIKGFVPWDQDLVKILEEIILHMLGAINVDSSGRISVKVWKPGLIEQREFSDTKKNVTMSMTRDTQDMINWVNIRYRKNDVWPWTDDEDDDLLDGLIVDKNQDSYDDYGQWFSLNLKTRWYNANGTHVTYPSARLTDKYSTPPRRFNWKTGLDGLQTEIGDIVSITDDKLGFDSYAVEVMKKEGNYTSKPAAITFEAEDTGTQNVNWAFIGSSSDEGDGLSPQAATFLTATDTDKQFCYISQTGGSGSTGPDYYIFTALIALSSLFGTIPL